MRRDLGVFATALSLLAVGVLPAATITVDSSLDDLDLGPNGNCTLREAIVAANTNNAVDACPAGDPGPPTTDRIVVPAGTFTLTIAGSGEDSGMTGDLDLSDNVVIEGAGARLTLVDAAGLDRVLDVDPGGVDIVAVATDLTLRGGFTTGAGGGVRNGGTLSLERANVSDSLAAGAGGGIQNNGDLFVIQSTISGNTSNDHGGALDGHGQSFFQNSTISGNTVNGPGAGGGLYNFTGETMTVINSTIIGNAAGIGDAIHNVGTFTVSNSVISGDCDGGATTTNGGNLETPGNTCALTAGSDQVDVGDPVIGLLADNGGPTDTHSPLRGSPAIDSAEADACPTLDQRGALRPFDGDGNEIAICDVGAVEAGAPILVFEDGFESGDTGAWTNVAQ